MAGFMPNLSLARFNPDGTLDTTFGDNGVTIVPIGPSFNDSTLAESAKAEQVVVTDAALERLDFEGVRKGRRRRLRADGTPSDLRVAPISRVASRSAVD